MHIKQKLHQSIKLLDNRLKSTDKCETNKQKIPQSDQLLQKNTLCISQY